MAFAETDERDVVRTYNAERIKAISSAISVGASLTRIDLSSNKLCVRDEIHGVSGEDSVMDIAMAIFASTSLTQISLSDNNLGECGYRSNSIKALSKAISISSSLTECILNDNSLESRWCTIFDTLRNNSQNNISKWNLRGEEISPEIAESLGAYAAASASLTQVLAPWTCWE